jgi:hypothetical protein
MRRSSINLPLILPPFVSLTIYALDIGDVRCEGGRCSPTPQTHPVQYMWAPGSSYRRMVLGPKDRALGKSLEEPWQLNILVQCW